MERAAERLRVALVEDHELVRIGIAGMLEKENGIELVASVASVTELASLGVKPAIVVLDLRLADGSSPGDNVEAIRQLGADTLVLTAGDDPRLVRLAARAGVLGVVRKASPAAEFIDALLRAGQGETIATTDWAAALDADAQLPDARLSAREREILGLYASGEKAQSVAFQTGLSKDTVSHYISRIRLKYATVGRPAHTKIDQHKRAVEDGLMPESA